MEGEIREEVVIVGGGIAGLATAVALKRVGVKALVLERAGELRATGSGLTLLPNAWIALDSLGVSHKLLSAYRPFSKTIVTNLANGVAQQVDLGPKPTQNEGIGPRTVHRKALLEALAQELPDDSIRFSSKLISIETQLEGNEPVVFSHLDDGTSIKSKILIGCDGVNSIVAKWLGLAEPAHSGRSAVRGMAVFPESHGFEHEVQWFVDAGIRAGFMPLNATDIYWFFCCQYPPTGRELESDPKLIQKEVLKYTEKCPSVYKDVVNHSDLSTLTWAPLTLRYPWHIIFGKLNEGNITVAGDAMHPMTPDMAQGGCSSLEDAVVLGRHIGNAIIQRERNLNMKHDMTRAIEEYVKERRSRVVALVTGSYISGVMQQEGSSWWRRFLRDVVFYKYFFPWMTRKLEYDCGKLPHVEVEDSKKLD